MNDQEVARKSNPLAIIFLYQILLVFHLSKARTTHHLYQTYWEIFTFL